MPISLLPSFSARSLSRSLSPSEKAMSTYGSKGPSILSSWPKLLNWSGLLMCKHQRLLTVTCAVRVDLSTLVPHVIIIGLCCSFSPFISVSLSWICWATLGTPKFGIFKPFKQLKWTDLNCYPNCKFKAQRKKHTISNHLHIWLHGCNICQT